MNNGGQPVVRRARSFLKKARPREDSQRLGCLELKYALLESRTKEVLDKVLGLTDSLCAKVNHFQLQLCSLPQTLDDLTLRLRQEQEGRLREGRDFAKRLEECREQEQHLQNECSKLRSSAELSSKGLAEQREALQRAVSEWRAECEGSRARLRGVEQLQKKVELLECRLQDEFRSISETRDSETENKREISRDLFQLRKAVDNLEFSGKLTEAEHERQYHALRDSLQNQLLAKHHELEEALLDVERKCVCTGQATEESRTLLGRLKLDMLGVKGAVSRLEWEQEQQAELCAGLEQCRREQERTGQVVRLHTSEIQLLQELTEEQLKRVELVVRTWAGLG